VTGRPPFDITAGWLQRIALCALFALTAVTLRTGLSGQQPPTVPETEPAVGDAQLAEPVRIYGDIAHQWSAGVNGQVAIVRGNCRVEQGTTTITGRQMVVWQGTQADRDQITVYLEDDVSVTQPGSTRSHQTLYLELNTQGGITWQVRWPREYNQPVADPLFDRASERRRTALGQNRNLPLNIPLPGPDARTYVLQEAGGPTRRIRAYARTGQQFSFRTETSSNTTPPEQVGILTGGIKLNVDAPRPDGSPDPKAIELAADSAVIWTGATELDDLLSGQTQIQTRDTRLQFYLEGNIVIRQGDTVLKAARAYYDVQDERALLIDAEMKLFIPQAETALRVRAERIRQLTPGAFHAQRAWMSASHFGKPGYRLEASDIFYEPRVINPWVHAQGGWVDPVTGQFDDGQIDWMTTLNNRVMVGDTPVGFFPYLSSPAENPNLPIQRAAARSDSVFGQQLRTAWDPFHLFALDAPESLSASLLLDYYSRRGPGAGLEGAYDGEDFFGIGDKYQGEFHGYYVYDNSRDNLGLDRRSLIPDQENRGRLLARHRHDLPSGMKFFGEAGYVSDRNFLEQWYENEFDRDKDNERRLSLEQTIDNLTWSVAGRVQINEFENNTEWLPKADLFVLGEPLAGSPVSWTSHSSLGYAHINRADLPTDPNDLFIPLPYYSNVEGEVLMTRHELAMPVLAGPAVLTPYLRGEAAHWGEDLAGNDFQRLVGTAGLRGSLSFWKVLPYVQSDIFNLNGLAHRMTFDFDWSYTDSTEDYTRLPQYNEFDDDAQERFRQRFPFNTFGGALPTVFDARRYAIRTGAGSLVSAPYHELVDDLHVIRFGWRHRLQTKVGPPDNLRIRDWMTLDLEASFFPRAGHHAPSGVDFGEDWGLYSARWSWLFSERTTLLANALYDTFDGGQQIWNVGVLNQRSARGSLYLGVRQIQGQSLDSQIFTGSFSYLMSEKWVATASTAYDLEENLNRGQSFGLTRIGADFLFHIGAGFDPSKDNVGVAIALEPRFGPRTPYSTQMSTLLGVTQ